MVIVCDNRSGHGGRRRHDSRWGVERVFQGCDGGDGRLFPRGESRLLARDRAEAMLTGLETRNCWKLAEALGHTSPYRLQHFLSRGVWDHDAVRDRTATWAVGELAEDDAVLIVDETGDKKSSTDAVGAARQ